VGNCVALLQTSAGLLQRLTMSLRSVEREMRVSELMSKKVEWVSPTLSLRDAASKMRDLDIGCLPVGENDRLVGMITDRDIACRGFAARRAPGRATVRGAMPSGITYCFDDQDVSEAAHLMEEKHIRRLPVLNRQKRMVGILSLGDISQHAPGRVSAEVLKAVTTHGHPEAAHAASAG
jgi:CBS domain-containing protein